VVAAARAGWPATGLWFEAGEWTEATTREVRRRLDDTGVVALDLEPVIMGPDGDPGDALVDAAAGIGARHVLVASRVPVGAAVVDRFAALCDRAAPAGVVVVLEFLPIFPLAALHDAVAVVAAVGRDNAAVLVDALHLARCGASPADVAAARATGTRFPYLQIADAPATAPDTGFAGLLDEAVHGRLLPGDGSLPLAALLEAVPGVPLSFELRSRQLRADHPDPVERARAVWESATAWLDRHEPGTQGSSA
jgi:sugar phosphate isomerase/epimerase